MAPASLTHRGRRLSLPEVPTLRLSNIVYALRKYTVSNIHNLSYVRMITKYA